MNSILQPKTALGKIFKNNYMLVFVLGFCTALAFFLPFLIMDKGLFIYYGDYNVQQIPFYQSIHDAVRSGSFSWSWTTDLGANTVGSYTFYMLTSPFFWMTLPFPSEAVPYLMAPMLMVKFGLIAVTGYAYIKRFVKSEYGAIAGALMYAFCGFNLYNIFFNHFHEAVLIFPLLLIALEEYLVNDRRGVFALTIALSAVINYYFFFGQVIFLVLYFFLRISAKDVKMSFRRFGILVLEAALGVLLSMVTLLPSALAAFGNNRVSNLLSGMDLFIYGNAQRYGLIAQSFFFPPDIPARPNFFPESNAKWSSVSMFLPVISMTGVFAYFMSVKKSFQKWLLIIVFGACFIPGLNALFSMMNASYYARWFYMPLLIMATVSIIAMERYSKKLKPALILTSVLTALFALIGIMPKKQDDTFVFFALPADSVRFWTYVCIAGLGILCTLLLIVMRYKKREMFKTTIIMVCAMSVVTGFSMISMGKSADSYYASYDMVHNKALNGGSFALLADEDYYRIDTYDELDNLGMYWGMPTINAFHSIVPASVMEYYESIGVERGVGSRPAPSHRGLRAMLNVKYRFVGQGRDYIPTDGFEYIGLEDGYMIYENKNFIGMGCTYEKVLSRSEYNELSEGQREEILLDAICLEDEDYKKYGKLLQKTERTEGLDVFETEADFTAACQKRNSTNVEQFWYDNSSFTAKTTLEKENLVFFSVPYDDGWSVTVNGKEAEVIKANVGFMAVDCDAGENTIEFHYKTPGLLAGVLLTGIALLLLAAYLTLVFLLRKKGKLAPIAKMQELPEICYDDCAPSEEITAHDAYLRQLLALTQPPQNEEEPKNQDGL